MCGKIIGEFSSVELRCDTVIISTSFKEVFLHDLLRFPGCLQC